jgi:hypothetical protein
MKHPIHFIMAGGAGCFITGAVLFITGIASEKPVLKTAGCWFAIAAFAIASLPLFAVLVMTLVEKLRRK